MQRLLQRNHKMVKWVALSLIVFTTWTVALTVDVGNLDDESLLCYKPPPADDNKPNQLILYDVDIVAPQAIGLIKVGSAVSIFGKCGVSFWAAYQTNITVIPSAAYLSCEFQNQTRVYQTSEPTTHLDAISAYTSNVALVNASLTFSTTAAADGALDMLCQIRFHQSGGILGHAFVNSRVTLQIKGCPHGRHGTHCDESCSCAIGVECHPFTAECVCPLGLQGERCDQVNPTFVRTGPTTLFVPFGKTVTLTCIGYGMEPSFSRWEHNMELQARNYTEDVPYFPRPFHVNTTFTATNPDINGIYTCTVMNRGKVYRQNLTVIITDIPDPFLELPVNQTVILGTSTELRCRTKPEAGTLTWERGNQTTDQHGMRNQSLTVWEGNQTISIAIDPVRFENAGRYRCIVGHIGADDKAVVDAWITVQSQGTEPLFVTPTLPSMPGYGIKVLEGQKVMLSCSVFEAYPEPNIRWFVGEKDITADSERNASISSNGVSYDVHSFRLFSPTWLDNGQPVYCISTVANFKPRYSNRKRLNVSYVPKVSVSPDETTVQPNSSPYFVCEAPANPSVSAYNWTLERQDGAVIMNYTGRHVVIHNVDSHYNKAILTCRVTNDVGANSSKAVIKVFDDPDKDHLNLGLLLTFLFILLILMMITPIVVYRHRGKIQDLFFRHQTTSNQGKAHDVFVAYKGGGTEEKFVINSLVPKLQEWGCDVCIHYQNFLPGREIAENITAAVSSSRKTILVLSPDFIASEWCYFEFLCAVDEMLRNQTNFIIPLMFEDIRHDGLCHSMQHLIDTVSFIPWPASGQTDEFWALLKKAVEIKFNVNEESQTDSKQNYIYDVNDNETILEI